jgi:hypothetical protein
MKLQFVTMLLLCVKHTQTNSRRRIFDDLLPSYNKQIRPVHDLHTPTNVSFGLAIVNFIQSV